MDLPLVRMEAEQRIATVVPTQKIQKRIRRSASAKALRGLPLESCFTKTGFIAKDVQWHEPCVLPEVSKHALKKPDENMMKAVSELRDCMLDKRIPTRDIVQHTVSTALHVCLTQNRPVRSEVAIGAFKLSQTAWFLHNEPWGIPLTIDRRNSRLDQLGILGVGPELTSNVMGMYRDSIETNGPYTTKEITAIAFNFLASDLMVHTPHGLDMKRFVEGNESSLAAILGMALTCIPGGAPARKVGSLGPWGTDSAMLVINQSGIKIEIDFKGKEHASISLGPRYRTWTFDHLAFYSLCAALLTGNRQASANGLLVRFSAIEDGTTFRIDAPSAHCILNSEKFRNLQFLLQEALDHDLTRRWFRYYELSRGVF